MVCSTAEQSSTCETTTIFAECKLVDNPHAVSPPRRIGPDTGFTRGAGI
jgi:hypothetical protein